MGDDRNKCGPAGNDRTILSRRSLLELAGIAVATAALPHRAVVAKPSLNRDTTGSVTFNSPATFVSGDTIRVTITYNV